ncbi:MAG TPA: polysaccharide biosynthesis C-terminal domain-containing protein [Solirubrobacteraceae bacterium]|nr:polysaccharide biosynthesis C-terminal domain-containing protein [Solirubrobacteraceae bacterium]
MSYVARLNSVRRVPLYRSSFALMLTTGFNGLLGFAYWVLAARLYPAKAVSVGAGAISAMTLVSSLGWVGLQYVLLRFVPVAGGAQTRLVRLTYTAALAIGVGAAGIFLLGFARLAGLGELTQSPLTALLFVASIALWVIFSLQDPVLIGLRRAGWVPIENAAFGAIKAVLLVVLAASASAWAIFGAWVLGLVGLVLVVNVALFGRLLRSDSAAPSRLPPRRQLIRFATGHHFVAVTAAIPDSLVSLLVLAFMPGPANAYYYSAWAVSFSFRLLAVNMSNALIVEGALAEAKLRSHVLQVSRLALVVVVPLVVFVVLFADPIMKAFGLQYAHAANLLRLFAIALIPFTIVNFVIAVERIRQRAGRALLIAGCSTVATIGLDVWLIPSAGLTGAGWGWLIGQILGALIAIWFAVRGDGPAPARSAKRDHETKAPIQTHFT